MKIFTLKLTTTELELVAALAADQLFRKEFIDPRLPGHTAKAGDISLGKALVSRFRLLLNPDAAKRMPQTRVIAERNIPTPIRGV